MRHAGMTHDAGYPSPASVSRDRLSVLRSQVLRSVVDGAPDQTDEQIAEAISMSIEEFVASGANVAESVTKVAPLLDKIGSREARRRPDAGRLHQSFKMANVAVQRGLVHVVGDLITRDVLLELRQDLASYLAQLHKIAVTGFEQTQRLVSLSPEGQLAELRAIVFAGASPRFIDELATSLGVDLTQRVAPLISIHHELPEQIRNHPQVLVDNSGTMALLAVEWEPHLEHITFRSQAVLGPPSTIARCRDGVALARNAATLLREGTVIDPRPVVPSVDLLGDLLIRGNRLLTELLIDKHLAPLEDLNPARRLVLAEILLLSLERGMPLNRIARDLGIATQTAHNRMNALRLLLGDKLDDGDHRLEMMVALRAAMFRWRTPD